MFPHGTFMSFLYDSAVSMVDSYNQNKACVSDIWDKSVFQGNIIVFILCFFLVFLASRSSICLRPKSKFVNKL